MKEKLCKNCKNWEREYNETDNRFPLGSRHYGLCSSTKFNDIDDEMDADSLAVSSHDNEHDFFTGENFGCIHFKEK